VVQSCLRWFDEVVRVLNQAQSPVDERLSGGAEAFARWYRGRGSTRYGQFDAYQAIGAVHARSHALAGELLALAHDGEFERARTRLPELDGLRSELLSSMGDLVRRLRDRGSEGSARSTVSPADR
jgi:hypothetical protein